MGRQWRCWSHQWTTSRARDGKDRHHHRRNDNQRLDSDHRCSVTRRRQRPAPRHTQRPCRARRRHSPRLIRRNIMSFYTSLSGLKAAQTDLAVIANNVANVGSAGFKKSRAVFGDLFASSPTQATKMIAGQGARLNGITQQFTQGTLEATDKTLDLAVAGEGMFVVRGDPPRSELSYTRNGAFTVMDGKVTDTIGSTLQLLPVDATGAVTD